MGENTRAAVGVAARRVVTETADETIEDACTVGYNEQRKESRHQSETRWKEL